MIAYATALGAQYIIYSGLNQDDDAALEGEISRLGTMADTCASRGVTLLFHNHDWEFRNGARIWRRLQAARIDSLGFAPDLGWAVKGGMGMDALLHEIGGRVHVLHFKDFISWDDGQNTCHLGEGVVDFAPAWTWLGTQPNPDIWVTAEQDRARDNDVAAERNAAWLRTRLDGERL